MSLKALQEITTQTQLPLRQKASMESENQRRELYRLLNEHIDSLYSTKKEPFCLTTDKYKKAMQACKLSLGEKCEDGGHFKHWAQRHFKLERVGMQTLLFCKKTNHPVVAQDDVFDTLLKIQTNNYVLNFN